MSTIEPIKSGFCLRVLEGSHNEEFHPLSRSVISIGRSTPETPYSSSYITFPEPTVSRLHIVLTWEPGASAYMVHHRSQTNPTLLNGKQVKRSEILKPGDVLALGRLVLTLEETTASTPAISLPKVTKEEVLTLNVRNRSDKSARVYCVPVQKSRLILQFNPERTTAAIAAEQTSDQSQLVALPAKSAHQLSFHFDSDSGVAQVETDRDEGQTSRTLRRSVLSFGLLEMPLRVGAPLSLSKNELLNYQDFQIWLASGTESKPPHSTLDGSPYQAPAEGVQGDRRGGVLEFRNGPWVGGRILTPAKGSQTFLIGPETTSFGREFPLTNIPSCRITIQDNVARIRVNEVADDQFVDANGDLLFTGESALLFSGSHLLLGESEFYWEVPDLHKEYSRFTIEENGEHHPICKEVVKIGTAAHCEISLKSKSVAPVAGELRFQDGQFLYAHQNIAMPARVDGNEVSSGLECTLHEGSSLELAPGVTVRLTRQEANNC